MSVAAAIVDWLKPARRECFAGPLARQPAQLSQPLRANAEHDWRFSHQGSRMKVRGKGGVVKARSDCPIASTLDLVGDRWSLLIVRDMLEGKRRYGEFLAAPERIAPMADILASRLERMIALGLIRRLIALGLIRRLPVTPASRSGTTTR